MKTRFSKTTQWIIVIAIMVALLVSGVIIYSRQQARHDELSGDLAQALQDFERNSRDKADLEGRLTQAEAELSYQGAQFPTSAEALEIQQGLLAAADLGQVTVASLGFSGPTGEGTFQVYSVSLNVTGELEALLNFNQMLGYWFPSATIGSVALTTSDGGGTASMNLSLRIYTLGG